MRVAQLGRLALPELEPAPGRPLELTPVVHPDHHEEVIRWWMGRLGDRPVVEVDLDGGLLPASERLLRRRLDAGGPGGTGVVVRIAAPEVDLEAVAALPALVPFDHLVLAAPHRPRSARVRRVAELAAAVRGAAGAWYEAQAEELGLGAAAWPALAARLDGLHDPVESVEALNDLVEVQLAGVDAEAQVPSVLRRILGRQLGALGPGALLLLVGRALGGDEARARAPVVEAGGEQAALVAEAELAAADLWLAGRPRRLAAWLGDPDLAVPVFGAGGLPHASQRREGWGVVLDALPRRVRRFFGARVSGWAAPELEALAGVIEEGRLEEARRYWEALAERPGPSLAWTSDIELLAGRLLKREGRIDAAIDAYGRALDAARRGELPVFEGGAAHGLAVTLRDNGRWSETEPLFREALRHGEEGGATPTSRGITLDELARGLRDHGRWPEAEPLFREALRLAEEGGETPTSRGITLQELAIGLRDNVRWPEAEPLFREALRLKEEGGATPTSRGITLHELAIGLLDHDRWPEAEPLFREALRLKEEGGDTPTSRGITLHELAIGLRDNGRWPEAEPLFREALRLKEEGGATLTSRGITLHALAMGLRDHGRWPEAEPLFREALRLKEEGGATPTSRGSTLHELAIGLRDHDRWPEAEPLFREALRLAEEGGDPPTSRGITLHELAIGLRDHDRWPEAESLFREALRLAEEGGDPPTSRGITLHALARGLRDHGRWPEAEPLFREALRLKEEGGAPAASIAATRRALQAGRPDAVARVTHAVRRLFSSE